MEGGGCDLISRYNPEILLECLRKTRKNVRIAVILLKLKLVASQIEMYGITTIGTCFFGKI